MGIIRFILSCAVVLSHTSTLMGYSPVAGNLAVQCFYIISGFYIAMILTEKYNGPGMIYGFYSNRVLKLYPVYWLNLILLLIWNLFVFSHHYPSTFDFYTKYAHPGFWAMSYFVLSNLLIVGLDWAFFLGIHSNGTLFFTANFNDTKPCVYNYAFNGVGWTIGLELMFYLIAPWLNKRSVFLLIALFGGSLFLRFYLSGHLSDGPQWSYMFFPTQLMLFITGMISYRIYARYIREKVSKKLQYLCYILLLGTIMVYYQIFSESYYKQAVLFLSVATCMPFAFELTRKSRMDRFLGNLSYYIYISQTLVVRLVDIKKFPKLIDKGFTALILVILAAVLINRFIGEPLERYRAQRVWRLKKQAAGVS